GKKISIQAGENTLFEAIKNSAPGDIIELEEAGEYLMTKSISFSHPVTVQAKEGLSEKPLLLFERTTLFNIENGGSLSLKGIEVSGRESDDKPGNAVIRTSKYSMVHNYKLEIRDCVFKDLDVNHSFEVLKIFKNTFAESIIIEDSRFENISGSVLAMDKESDDIGIYNVENVEVRNSLFKDVGGAAINLYRGGRDESTFGPILRVDHCVFDEVGKDKRNATDASLAIHGVQDALIENSIFNESKPLRMHLVVGEPVIKILNNNLYNSGRIISNDPAYQTSNLSSQNPTWSADSYQLSVNSPLKAKGRDNKDLGLLLE
ncbi:MAG: alginate lyase, partial [Bacteroidota bacterium]